MPPSARAAPLALLCACLLVAGGGGVVRADSWIVRESSSADLGATPSLGRGFTPAISSYHSVCFDSMPTTRSSFDFDYSFEDLELDEREYLRRRENLRTYEVEDFLARNTSERTVVVGKSSHYVHYILASLVVDSYYASIDEAHASIAKDALELLRTQDLVSFFTSCGTHYIRSMSRRSYFLTLFSYETTEKIRDRDFELKLEQTVRKMNGAAKEEVADPKAPATRPAPDFAEEARRRELKLVTRSVGLVAQKSSALLPFDLASYQDSVKEAFKATQDESVGRVTSMEIMPWLSNTTVLALINQAGERDKWTERKRILTDNAEFYIELSSYMYELQSISHRAEACRREIDTLVYVDGKLKPEYAHATVVNHRTGEHAPLSLLLDALTDKALDSMRTMGLALRNGADGQGGAGQCMEQLEKSNLSGIYHNSIPVCKWSRARMPNERTIREYCMPQIEGVASTYAPAIAPQPTPPATAAEAADTLK